jgi:hypothetical protein
MTLTAKGRRFQKSGSIEKYYSTLNGKSDSLSFEKQIPSIVNNPNFNGPIQGNISNPVVFISYSWDSEVHKQWVLEFAKRLLSDGIDVKLDRYELKPGRNLPYFIENAINISNKIIIIFTPNYKLKADNKSGGVGYEYSIINSGIYKNIPLQEKVIPVLRSGEMIESIPEFMQQYIYLNLSNDSDFEENYITLLRELYNEPAVIKPSIGKRPNF